MKQILFLIALFFTSVLYGQPGFVDSSFGQNGFVSGNFPSQINSISSFDNRLLATGGFNASGRLAARFLDNGGLDSTFGKDGYTYLNEPKGGGLESIILPDKKILVCGGFVDEHFNFNSFIAKFTSNGKIDSSFGDNGISIIPMFHKADFYSEIALNNDGSIIIGGSGTNSVNTLDSQYSVISRLSSNGVFDKTFGDNGYVLNLTSRVMNDLAIQADGKIVTACQDVGYNFVFSRYNADGSLDKSFGTDGNKVLRIGEDNTAKKIIIQPNGKLIIGGYLAFGKYEMCALRLNPDGSLDKSFGTDGNKVLRIGEDNTAKKIIIQPNGKLIIGGYLAFGKYEMCALRLNPDGSLDETFGNNGKTLIDFENNTGQAYDMLQQPDGKFVLAGNAYDSKQNRGYFGLCRITKDGKLDSSFGINGLQTTAYGINNGAYCAALQSDGKIVLGGFYKVLNAEASYLIVRYNNDEATQKQTIIKKIKHYAATHNNIQSTSLNNVFIYPNPAQNVLHIAGLSSNQITKLTVVDIAGNIKLQAVANESSCSLNIASLNAGNYLLKIEMNDAVATKQFIKQ